MCWKKGVGKEPKDAAVKPTRQVEVALGSRNSQGWLKKRITYHRASSCPDLYGLARTLSESLVTSDSGFHPSANVAFHLIEVCMGEVYFLRCYFLNWMSGFTKLAEREQSSGLSTFASPMATASEMLEASPRTAEVQEICGFTTNSR
ncbi:hypothetical protein C8R44DRAFT_873096 [Mycena epipterygia]|nr:hypothetical protein C8R44DRAFT_873096 [Mycena epipterygia]